jgi:hypothetical protein
VTSMTYESDQMRLPRGASTLDAIDKARNLKGLKLKIADVRGGDEVGYIAFTDD